MILMGGGDALVGLFGMVDDVFQAAYRFYLSPHTPALGEAPDKRTK